jgi:hypothetical protein
MVSRQQQGGTFEDLSAEADADSRWARFVKGEVSLLLYIWLVGR